MIFFHTILSTENRFETRFFSSREDEKRIYFSTLTCNGNYFDIFLRAYYFHWKLKFRAWKNIFPRYFEKNEKKKKDIFILFFRRTTNKETKYTGGILRYIFEKAKEYFIGRDVENPLCIDVLVASISPPRENRPSTLFALGKQHNCSFSPQPLSPLNPCPSVSKHFVNHLSVARVVRKLELGRRSHQFTTHSQKKLIFRRNEIGRIKKGI